MLQAGAPDAIVGFVTRGRGVSIHRAGCGNVQRLAAERMVEAAWGESAGATYPVEVEVQAAERTGLRRDIAEALARERIPIVSSVSAASDAAVRLRYVPRGLRSGPVEENAAADTGSARRGARRAAIVFRLPRPVPDA